MVEASVYIYQPAGVLRTDRLLRWTRILEESFAHWSHDFLRKMLDVETGFEAIAAHG